MALWNLSGKTRVSRYQKKQKCETVINRKILLCLIALFYLFVMQFPAYESCVSELKQCLVDVLQSAAGHY